MKIKHVFSLFLALLLLLIFSGCVPISDSSPVSAGTVQSNNKSSDNQNTQSKTESSAQTIGKVGMFLQNDKWKITLLSAKEYSSVGSGYSVEKPADGKVFLALFFEVENISGKDDYFNYFDCKGYVDSYSVNLKIFLNKIDDISTLTGDIAAGKKLKGYLAWEVPKDWKEFEFNFDEDLFSDGTNKFIFKVVPGDLTK